jgi:hypothetical protein
VSGPVESGGIWSVETIEDIHVLPTDAREVPVARLDGEKVQALAARPALRTIFSDGKLAPCRLMTLIDKRRATGIAGAHTSLVRRLTGQGVTECIKTSCYSLFRFSCALGSFTSIRRT